ncbi:MAG TPA: ribose-5-phosphate isomerase RpiA [Methanomicrobiales archaeon]|nr:ribose-5-phosphate isomerase RpiA [Methanomicrobiales archaeon]
MKERGDAGKRAAGHAAAGLVEDGMVVGLGTGSTVLYAMERLGKRIGEGLAVSGIPTSFQAEIRARALGIPLTTLQDHPSPDLAIDGADLVDGRKRLIKGRGGALTREKVVAAAAGRLVIVVDQEKCAEMLRGVVPVEVLPFALLPVTRGIEAIGGTPVLREGSAKDGPVVTDNGNFILDCRFRKIPDPEGLEAALDSLPGVISSGLFTRLTGKTEVIVGKAGGKTFTL